MSYASVFAANLMSAQRTAREAQDAEQRRLRRTRGRGKPTTEPASRTSEPRRASALPPGLVPRFGQTQESTA